MKISITIKQATLYLLLLLFSTNLIAQDWEVLAPYPFSDYKRFNDIYVDDEGFGWMVGFNGDIRKTVNGGETWEDLNTGFPYILEVVDYIPSTNGMKAIISSNDGLILTTDGGNTWEATATDLINSFLAIEVLPSGIIFVSSHNGELIKSTDAGESWEILLSDFEEDIQDLSFINDSKGWATTREGIVFQTLDGGENWTLLVETGYNQTKQMHFFDDNTGVLTAQGTFLKTTDGGLTWNELEASGAPVVAEELLALDENNMMLLAGNGYYVYITTDGGDNWSGPIVVEYGDIESLHATASGQIWAVGTRDVVLHSEDTGVTWTELFPADKSSIRSVNFLDENVGFIGKFTRLLKTVDGGETWELAADIGPHIFDIEFLANGEMLCSVGSNGIIRSTDGGFNWTVSIEETGFIRGIYQTPNGTLFAAVASNYLGGNSILRSTDNGESWEETELAQDIDIYNTDFPTDLLGFAFGDDGIARTTDGGDNWEILDVEYSGILQDVFFLNENNGWLLTHTTMYETTDGGNTWTESNAPNGLFRKIRFYDENNGITLGGTALSGFIYTTTNGGETWEEEYFGNYNLEELAIVENSDGIYTWVVGTGGIVLRKSDLIESINERKIAPLAIYPNPANEVVFLKNIENNGTLSLYDAQGRLIWQKSLNHSDDYPVSVNNLAKGIYYFYFSDGEKEWGTRWVKE